MSISLQTSRSIATRRPPRLARRYTLSLPLGFRLEHGGTLPAGRIAFEAVGNPDGPVVAVLGGISAGRHVTSNSADEGAGWWEGFVGTGKALDPRRALILSVDYLGGLGDSSGPDEVRGCVSLTPLVTPGDQARALVLILNHLGIDTLDAVVGSSYGGMVGLALGEQHPTRVRHVVSISGAHESHPMATALRILQRQVTQLGRDSRAGADGLAIARGLAVTTYRSSAEFSERFSNRPEPAEDGIRFPVQAYLEHQGEQFVRRCPVDRFLCMSQSLDLHRVEPDRVRVPTTLVAVVEDTLVPLWQMRALYRALPEPVALVEINSRFGHDAFLKEIDVLTPVVAGAVGSWEVAS